MSRNRMWTSTEMRVALARHDIGTVFRIMQRYGFPQREIAATTGMAQSDISEVISGGRNIQAYVVLDWLAEGLQLPRGWAGLAFDDETAMLRDLEHVDLAVCVVAGVDLARPTSRYGRVGRQSRRRAGRLTAT